MASFAKEAARRFAAAPPPARRSDPNRIPTTVLGRARIDDAVADDARRRVARKLGKHAGLVERIVVRFTDTTNGADQEAAACRIVATLCDTGAVVVEKRAAEPALALRRAADTLGRTLQRAMRHAGQRRTVERPQETG